MPTIVHEPTIDTRIDLPAVRGLVAPRRPLWTAKELRDLTATFTTRLAVPLSGIVQFTSPQRWWTRLALTDEVEVWLLSWLPGQETRPHDHGGASGAFSVLLGELSETYRYPGGPIRSASHATGRSIGFGAGRAHQMRNLSSVAAASVHAYSPPNVPTRDYPSLRDIPDHIPAPAVPGGPDERRR